ncbi:MAG: hypothetical protein N2050_01280 [Flavobacteriales bacterium]|nr:hypothetical protein [Flavobacteriales bacterium]
MLKAWQICDAIRPILEHSVAFLTRHGKERQVAPILAEAGLQVQVAEGFDTDLWGTFSGEVARPAGQRETALLKARKALELNPRADFGLGSEGAFNPHPASPFLYLNTEVLVLYSPAWPSAIVGRAFSSDVAFLREKTPYPDDVRHFAEKCGFPAYGVILKAESEGRLIKASKNAETLEILLRDWEKLRNDFPGGVIYAETDLRAHRNPARQRIIEEAARDLLRRYLNVCPSCGRQGFGPEENVPGLPCGLCGFPTRLAKATIWRCPHCAAENARPPEHGQSMADPAVCLMCNP